MTRTKRPPETEESTRTDLGVAASLTVRGRLLERWSEILDYCDRIWKARALPAR